jgi:hypothetical protein
MFTIVEHALAQGATEFVTAWQPSPVAVRAAQDSV